MDDLSALGRSARACELFRWLPGMLTLCGGRVLGVRVDGWLTTAEMLDDHDSLDHRAESACLPDLSDPATLGCFLGLVREAWGDSDIVIGLAANGWYPSGRTADMRGVYGYDSEAEALVAALRAAGDDAAKRVYARPALADKFEWFQTRGTSSALGLLRSEGWIARFSQPGQIRACRQVGTTRPAPGWQRKSVGDALREIGVRWPLTWPDHMAPKKPAAETDRARAMTARERIALAERGDRGLEGPLEGLP